MITGSSSSRDKLRFLVPRMSLNEICSESGSLRHERPRCRNPGMIFMFKILNVTSLFKTQKTLMLSRTAVEMKSKKAPSRGSVLEILK